MNKTTFSHILLLLLCCNSFYSQSIKNTKRIGVIFKIEGPFKMTREAIYNISNENAALDEKDKYYAAIQFLKTEKVNPVQTIKEYYLSQLKESGYEIVIITEDLNKENFPASSTKKNKFYLDMTALKNKYNIPQVFIVEGKYGLEFEDLGDKRTNISLDNFIVDTNNNGISEWFKIRDICNIKKKNLLNAPDYPNIVISMDKLLNDKIFPDIAENLSLKATVPR